MSNQTTAVGAQKKKNLILQSNISLLLLASDFALSLSGTDDLPGYQLVRESTGSPAMGLGRTDQETKHLPLFPQKKEKRLGQTKKTVFILCHSDIKFLTFRR